MRERPIKARDSGVPDFHRKEIAIMYFRSTATGQVYKLGFIPMGTGWELATEQEYIEYCRAMHIEPKK